MERALPLFEIEGVKFIVDVDFNLLRHPSDERIGYSFFEHMKDVGTGYALAINPDNLQPMNLAQKVTCSPVFYKIPYMVKLDPEGMKEKYSSGNLPETDRMLVNNEDLFFRREVGKPAALKIRDDYFFIDVGSGCFIGPGAGSSLDWLDTGKMSQDYFKTCFQCLYDPETKMEYKTDGKMVPERIIGLQLPGFEYCDSYNYARLYGRMNDAEFFRKHPVRSNMVVREVDIEQLGYSRHIPNNEEKDVRHEQQPSAGLKNSKRKGFRL